MSTSKGKEIAPLTTRKIKAIGVFGGTIQGVKEKFEVVARELGRTLATNKINLAYSGGLRNLGAITALFASAGGSQVLGISLYDFTGLTSNKPKLTFGTEIKVLTPHERISYMLHNVDAFIFLPGGFETFESFSMVAAWAQLNFHQKPLGFLNVDGFYDSLLAFLDHAVKQRFIPPTIFHLITSDPNIDSLLIKLQQPVPSLSPVVDLTKSEQEEGSKKRKTPDTDLRLGTD